MWPILLVSIAALALVVERWFRIRSAEKALVERFAREVRKHFGAPEWERKAAHAGSREIRFLESPMRWLPVLAQSATLLGLFGTVLGMVEVFHAIESAGGPADPRMLAGGIWTALITTVGGLAVAIPTSLAYHWLLARVDGLAAEMKDAVEELHDEIAASRNGVGDSRP